MPGETEETRKRFNPPVSRPSPSGALTVPPGETGGQGTVGAKEVQWKSTPQSSEEYYATGGQGQTNLNISNPDYPNYVGPNIIGGDGGDTGSGSTGGDSGYIRGGGANPKPLTLDQIRLFNYITDANLDILDTRGGIGNMRTKSIDGLGITDPQQREDLYNLQKKNINTKPTIQIDSTPKLNTETTTEDSTWSPNLDMWGGTVDLQKGAMTYTSGDNSYLPSGTQLSTGPTFQGGNLGWRAGVSVPFQQGGPVGLMSLPQGYANGGEVIEGEDTMEELTPFGGTRERVIDQVEAFDNAPHHIEEPMIGMWGEKIPLTTARRVQKYMEGMDPVKRGLIEEMMQMFQMKRMRDKMQDQQQSGQYFGPRPKEYSI